MDARLAHRARALWTLLPLLLLQFEKQPCGLSNTVQRGQCAEHLLSGVKG